MSCPLNVVYPVHDHVICDMTRSSRNQAVTCVAFTRDVEISLLILWKHLEPLEKERESILCYQMSCHQTGKVTTRSSLLQQHTSLFLQIPGIQNETKEKCSSLWVLSSRSTTMDNRTTQIDEVNIYFHIYIFYKTNNKRLLR